MAGSARRPTGEPPPANGRERAAVAVFAGWHTERMRRVLVVGMSGAGKTTAARRARRVVAKLGLPIHEMDALALGPDLSQPPGLVDDVKRITAQRSWIFDSWGCPIRARLLDLTNETAEAEAGDVQVNVVLGFYRPRT
jgi:hypothetical protein